MGAKHAFPKMQTLSPVLNSLSKIFGKVLFHQCLFDHLIGNDLPGHGTEKQLVSICEMK
jgi:hypothetical protein